MPTVILDHCTGTNNDPLAGRTPDTTNTPGGTWTDSGSNWTIQSNKLQSGAGSVVLGAIEAGSANVTVSAVINIGTAGGSLVCRYADDNNFILAIVNSGIPGVLFIFKRVAGSFTQLATSAGGFVITAGVDYTLTLSADSADLLTVSVNAIGATPITATDSAGNTNTKVGIYANGYTNTTWDDFQVDTAAVAGSPFQAAWAKHCNQILGGA